MDSYKTNKDGNKSQKTRNTNLKTKDKDGKGKGKQSQKDQWPANYCRECEVDGVKELCCRRFHLGYCRDGAACRYLHSCPVWTGRGPCLGDHPAWDHERVTR